MAYYWLDFFFILNSIFFHVIKIINQNYNIIYVIFLGLRRVEGYRRRLGRATSQKNPRWSRIQSCDAESCNKKFLWWLANACFAREGTIYGTYIIIAGRTYESFGFERSNLAG